MRDSIEVIYIQEKNLEKNQIVDELKINTEPNQTILEISLKNKIPHHHACGGNGKCSTCRILVIKGEENLTEPNELELNLIKKKGLGSKIRLACQTKVLGNIKIKRLVRGSIEEEIAISYNHTGKEVPLAVLFSDIRNFTSFTERHFAYDVVFILNYFYKKMGDAILHHNGYIDKFIGDGILGVFGIDQKDNQKKCQDAYHAALDMLKHLDEFNQFLKRNFKEEFKIGIGLHFGNVILGDMGHPEKKQITVIGDVVNFTSKLEKMTKKIKVPILATEDFIQMLGNDKLDKKKYQVQITGKTGKYTVYSLASTEKTYTSLRNLIKEHLTKSIAPNLLRLVFHDIMSGGSLTKNLSDEDALEWELKKEENKNLELSVKFIKKIKQIISEEPYSYRDIVYLAGAVAVEITGGPYINVIVPSYSDKTFFEAGIPTIEEGFDSFYKKFQKIGCNKRDMIALMGAHTLGKAEKPFTETPFTFDNSYFKRLYLNQKETNNLHPLFKTDWELLVDEECKKYIEIYAIDQNQFFEDFKNAYLKMLSIAL
ncbi:MAG: peroxidase family protein [Leptonema sp. (in: bacteria)]